RSERRPSGPRRRSCRWRRAALATPGPVPLLAGVRRLLDRLRPRRLADVGTQPARCASAYRQQLLPLRHAPWGGDGLCAVDLLHYGLRLLCRRDGPGPAAEVAESRLVGLLDWRRRRADGGLGGHLRQGVGP